MSAPNQQLIQEDLNCFAICDSKLVAMSLHRKILPVVDGRVPMQNGGRFFQPASTRPLPRKLDAAQHMRGAHDERCVLLRVWPPFSRWRRSRPADQSGREAATYSKSE